MTEPSIQESTEPIALPHLLEGRYELRRVLGAGGMGDVYAAVDTLLHREVAVKLLRPGGDAAAVARFHAEACALAALSSPFVGTIHDFGFAPEGLFSVMRHVPGRPLDALLADRGALPVASALRITRHVLGGLRALHERGLVHGDVKPGNVIITRVDRAVLIDLGVAADLRAGRPIGGGTPPYMAPEAAHGAAHLDGRADLFAAGILLVEALTGAAVSDRDEALRRAAALPAPLAAVVRTALEPDPALRFRCARAMRDALRAATRALRDAGVEPRARVASGATAAPSPSRRRRRTIRSRPAKPPS